MRKRNSWIVLIMIVCLFLAVGTARAADTIPFSGDLNGGGGANDLDKITSTEQGDSAIGILQGHATWGNGVFFFSLDVDGGAGDAEPHYVSAGDGGNERWVLGTLHNSTAVTALPQADHLWSGEVIRGINAGENIAQFDCVFLNVADGEWHQADADAVGEWPAWGMAVESLDGAWPATDGDPVWVLTRGVVRDDTWTGFSINDKVYLDETTAGGITATAPTTDGDCIQPIGRVTGTDGDEIYFMFDPLNGYYEHN